MSVSHQTVILTRGKHTSPRNGACVMELASMLAGEEFTDRPVSVCPVVGAFLRAYNDTIDDLRRQDLYRFAAAAVGTRGSAALARQRAGRCLAELRGFRRGVFRPRTLPESAEGMERVAGRAARELSRSGTGSHARALELVDELIAMGETVAPAPAPLSGSGRSRAGAAAR